MTARYTAMFHRLQQSGEGAFGAFVMLGDPDLATSALILDSLVETTLSRDVLLLNPVTKPALLRQLFQLACEYSAQILSYNKMLGQLQVEASQGGHPAI